MHRLMQNTELAIIPNGNHDCYVTQVELFNEIVVNYLLRQFKCEEEK
jgi:hypothetical protein